MKGFLVLSGVLATSAFTTLVPALRTSTVPPTTATSLTSAARTTTAPDVSAGHLVSTLAKRKVPTSTRGITHKELTSVVQRYCGSCHSATLRKGNLSLANYAVDSAAVELETTEKMIRQLRAQMMPPPAAKRPTGDTLVALVEALETVVDASGPANPGMRVFGRLNRAERYPERTAPFLSACCWPA